MKVFWTHIAREDRKSIYKFISAKNTSAAARLDADIKDRVKRASERPAVYKPGRVSGTREIVVRHNYIVVYEVMNDRLVVLRVLHTSLEWPVSDSE